MCWGSGLNLGDDRVKSGEEIGFFLLVASAEAAKDK